MIDPHLEKRNTMRYNRNDLGITCTAALVVKDQIEARLAMCRSDGVDVVNDQDSRLAERYIAHRLFGDGPPMRPDRTSWILRASDITDRFTFYLAETQALKERVGRWNMRFDLITDKAGDRSLEGANFSETVKVGNDVVLTLGKGGLHSVDEAMLFVADAKWAILDADFDSYYPAICLNYRICPAHLHAIRNTFLSEYNTMRLRRLQAKAGGPEQQALADGLKIAINSIFGKFGSAYSWLCDPTALVSITLLGQFTLLEGIDRLLHRGDVTLISCNTDGLTIKVPRQKAVEIKQFFDAWAAGHKLKVSWSEYSMVARRAINSYLASGPADARDDADLICDIAGNVVVKKQKGDFGYDIADLKKKAVNQVVIDAAQQFFMHRTDPEETIRACNDITKFCNYFKCNKGYTIVDDRGVDIGGIARWYLSSSPDAAHLDKVKLEDGSRTQLVERGARVINDLPASFPADVDHAAYVAMAWKLIKSVIEPETKYSSTIPLIELSAEQREKFARNYRTVEPDLERCRAIDLRDYKRDFAQRTKGNPYNTMLSLLPRLWLQEAGELTRGDLAYLACQIIEGDPYYDDRANQRSLVAWIDKVARDISPFPIPRTPEEIASRALIWAKENVQLLTRPNPAIHHKSAMDSRFVNRGAIERYGKTKNLHKLCCHIAACAVKHAVQGVDEEFILAVVADVEAHLALQAGEAIDVQALSRFDRIRRHVAALNATPVQ